MHSIVKGTPHALQVMALIAYLMEEKNNFGPHLIVVPNAVLVNWKAELNVWLPGVPLAAVPYCRIASLKADLLGSYLVGRATKEVLEIFLENWRFSEN
jgi:hypothetical protein